MGLISETVDGKILDWHFKVRTSDTLFYIGDIYLGQLFYNKSLGWSAVTKFDTEFRAIDGFISRKKAAEFLLKVFRKKKNEDNSWAPVRRYPCHGDK